MPPQENPPLSDPQSLRIMRLLTLAATLPLDTPVRHLMGFTAEQITEAVQIHAQQEAAAVERLLRSLPCVKRMESKFFTIKCKNRVDLYLEQVTYRFKESDAKGSYYTFVSVFVVRETPEQCLCGGPDPVGEKLREMGVQTMSAETAGQARAAANLN